MLQYFAIKIMLYASCPAYMQRQYLMYVVHVLRISKYVVREVPCAFLRSIHIFCSPDGIKTERRPEY